MVKGYVNSIQSLGTLDGPGVRFVVFLQGCNLRCKCCHNPDTWQFNAGKIYSAQDIVNKALRYKDYFGKLGGITLSGGEPILQPKFAKEIFSICKSSGINTCLDTSGSVLNDDVKELLSVTDRVLLDVKYPNNALYGDLVGCSLDNVLEFLAYLDDKKISTTIRQVIIPNINDDAENIQFLCELKNKYSCIDGVELLPFKKVCQVKYDNLKIPFPFADKETPTNELMNKLNSILKNYAK